MQRKGSFIRIPVRAHHPRAQWKSEGQPMSYSESYLMVALFFIVGLALPVVALSIGRLLRPHNPTPAKDDHL